MTLIKLVFFIFTFTFATVFDAAAQTGFTNPAPFSISGSGAAMLDSGGSGGGVTVGYAQVQANAGSITPAGDVILSFRDNGIVVSETTVPEVRPIMAGRIYAAYYGSVNTGVAMVNPNATDAVVTFYFTPGYQFCDCPNPPIGSFTLPAHSQIARFINEAPFNVSFGPSLGTMTFSSNIPIGVSALRGHTNELGEFLMTTLPVADLSDRASSDQVFFPEYADGGGWTTEVVLVNTTDVSISGTVQFLGPGGTTRPYSIAPRGMQNIATSDAALVTTVGAIRVTPDPGNASPSGLTIFSFQNNGVTLSEAGVPVLHPGQSFRMFAIEAGSYPGQLETGVAIANPSPTDTVTVTLHLTDLEGNSTGMTSTLTIPPLGQTAAFITQLPGFESIPFPFRGLVRLSTTASSGIALVGLRVEYNQLNNFLITTSTPVNEAAPSTSAQGLFPDFVEGGGYTTEFVLFSGSEGQASSGSLQFFTQSGVPLN